MYLPADRRRAGQKRTLCKKTFCKSLDRPCELSSGSHGSTALHLHAALSSAAAPLPVAARYPAFPLQLAVTLPFVAVCQHILFMCMQAQPHETQCSGFLRHTLLPSTRFAAVIVPWKQKQFFQPESSSGLYMQKHLSTGTQQATTAAILFRKCLSVALTSSGRQRPASVVSA